MTAKNDGMSRRELLMVGAGALAACATASKALRAEDSAMKKIPIGVQLYSIRTVIQKDIPGHFKGLKEMGFEGVEFAGYYGLDKNPAELRKMLDDAGLKCCGTHTALNTLQGDALKRTVELHKTLGNKLLMVPYLPLPTLEACEKAVKELTEIAAKLKPEGMVTGYHAHAGDFKKIGDTTPWEVIFGKTGPEVAMQLDTGNVSEGGGDPVALLKKYPGRTPSIHLKEYGGGVIGEGKVAWKDVLTLCATIGKTEWFIVEEEGGKEKSMDTVKRALNNLKKIING